MPWATLFERNKTRPEHHRLPPTVLHDTFAQMWADDAWGAPSPADRLQIIKQEIAA